MDGSYPPSGWVRSRPAQRIAWCEPEKITEGERALREETPVPFSHEGNSYAVILATLADLEDFAHGFNLTKGS